MESPLGFRPHFWDCARFVVLLLLLKSALTRASNADAGKHESAPGPYRDAFPEDKTNFTTV
jgi:hypothetical protein